jgi:thymidylate synthase
MEIIVDNVNEAFAQMWNRMHSGDMVSRRPSRNGPVLVSDYPVTTVYKNPRRRVLFHAARDANPFFHMFEAIWMLAGRQDVGFLQRFIPNFGQFSDDGETLYGAYGYRWAKHYLDVLISELCQDQTTRRAYLPIFEPKDVLYRGKDLPCNVGVLFQPDGGHSNGPTLNMSVFCRSNDMVLGAYGANVVHFSFLQEYVAALTGMRVGWYAQVSANFHLYEEHELTKKLRQESVPFQPLYGYGIDRVQESRIGIIDRRLGVNVSQRHQDWQNEAASFMNICGRTYQEVNRAVYIEPKNSFFSRIALPMFKTWAAWKHEPKEGGYNFEVALEEAKYIGATDWRYACKAWIQRRADRAKPASAQADGF